MAFPPSGPILFSTKKKNRQSHMIREKKRESAWIWLSLKGPIFWLSDLAWRSHLLPLHQRFQCHCLWWQISFHYKNHLKRCWSHRSSSVRAEFLLSASLMPLAPSSPISHSINDNNKKELPSGQVKRRSKEAKFSESRVFFQGISDCFSPIIPNFVTYTKNFYGTT